MRYGSVCSGIEAASVAWHPLGWTPAWFAEIEAFPSAVLKHHYPNVPNLGDMTALPARIRAGEVEAPDVLVGGTPCQAFSVAGLRQSLADQRGNLSLTFCEIADAIDDVRRARGDDRAIIVWENVPGVLSTKDNAFGCFLGALAGEDDAIGVAKWPRAGVVDGRGRRVAWCVLDAQFFGLAQRRRRVFVVAVPCELVERIGDRADPAEILSLGTCLRRNSPARPSSREVSPTIPSRSSAGGGLGTDFDCDGGVVEVAPCWWDGGDVAATITTKSDDQRMPDKANAQLVMQPVGVTIHGTDPTVQKVASYDDVAQCLRARTPGNIDNSSTTVVQQPVPFDTTQITSAANYSRPQPGDPCHPPAIAFAIQAGALRTNPNSGPDGVGVQADHAYTIEARAEVQAVTSKGMAVRRLTPEECEALQGFPRSYSAIPWRGKPAAACPDGPRYKALGNSFAVPVVAWIGQRIAAVEAIREEAAA